MRFIKIKNNKIEAAEQPTTPKPTATLPDNMVWAWDPKANQWIAVMKDNPVVTPPTYNPNNLQNTSTTTQMYTPIKSTLIDSLNQFLNGDKYSREIKIEKGLISNGLIKFAGINPIRGPKYSITDKGLNLLKQAAQEEYDFEKDYIKAKKSYLLDGISESEFKTGAPESQGQMPKFSIFEKDGSELAQIEAKNSTDAKVKFFMENPEYEGSQSIEVKEIDSTYSETTDKQLEESWNKYYPLYCQDIEAEKITEENYPIDDEVAQHLKLMLKGHLQSVKRYRKAISIMKYHTNKKMKKIIEDGHLQGLNEDEISKQVDNIAEEYYKKENKIKPTFNSLSEDYLKSFVFNIIKNKKSTISNNSIDNEKEIDSAYGETTTQGLDFPNQSVSPSTDVKVNPNGWVNMASNDNIDKKQTILKNLVYQHNKQNGEESAIGLSLDFDNKAVATGDLESLSEIETKLKDEGIACNITHREDFPEMYELTVFYTPKSAPTDKFATLKKKANGPFEFEATKDSIDFIIDKEFLIKLINVEPELKGTKLDPKKNEFDYIVDYKLSSNIEWKIDFETREYGIKNMSISVPWQTISIDIEYSPKSEAAPIKNDMSFSIRHDIIGVDIVMESENFNSIWMKGLQIEGEDNVKATF